MSRSPSMVQRRRERRFRDLIYLHNRQRDLGRLDFSNPASPSFSWLSDEDNTVFGFAVNSNGDAIIGGAGRTGSLSDQYIRVYLRAGGFLNISSSAGGCFTTGLGADAANYYYGELYPIPADGSTATVIPQSFAGDVVQLIRLN